MNNNGLLLLHVLTWMKHLPLWVSTCMPFMSRYKHVHNITVNHVINSVVLRQTRQNKHIFSAFSCCLHNTKCDRQ